MIQRNLKRAILVLFMPHEEDVTRLAVQSLALQLRPNDRVFVLLNGGKSRQLQTYYESFDQVTYMESSLNLGVAGGRNKLLENDRVQNADIVYLVDNDAIVPCDYLDRMQDFFLSQDKFGVVGPLVLNFRSLAEKHEVFSPSRIKRRLSKGHFFSNDELVKLLRGSLTYEDVDHAGTLEDHEYAYFSPDPILRGLLIRSGFHRDSLPSQMISGDRRLYERINKVDPEPWQVSNIPGCCQVFSGALLRELGLLDNKFNPYGYEDVDFCMRAIHSGRRNVVTPNVYILHRTDFRHAERKSTSSAFRVQKNLSRALSILEAKHRPTEFPEISFRRIYFQTLLEKVAETQPPAADLGEFGTMTNVTELARFKGLRQAAQQLYIESPENYRTLLTSRQNDKEKQLLAHFVFVLPHAANDDTVSSFAKTFASSMKEKEDVSLHSDVGIHRYIGKEIENDATASTGSFRARKYASVRQETIDEKDVERIQGLQNAYLGERCFIIGNGPSLKKTDLTFLKDEFTFGVNSIYLMEGMNGFRPTFYTVEDNHVVDDNLDEIQRLDAVHKFFPAKYKDTIGQAPNHYFLPVNWEFYYASGSFHNVPRFSKDISETLYVGQTVTYLNFQIAYYLGFRDIYIIGVDFHYEIPQSASIEGNSILSADADPNHFHPEYFGAGKKWHLPKLENCYKAYCHANQFAAENSFSIRDATIGGKLDAFPKVDFYDVVGARGRPVDPNRPLIQSIREVLSGVLDQFTRINLNLHEDTNLNLGDLDFALNHSGFGFSKSEARSWDVDGRGSGGTLSLGVFGPSAFVSNICRGEGLDLERDYILVLELPSSTKEIQKILAEVVDLAIKQNLRLISCFGSVLIVPADHAPQLDCLIGMDKELREFGALEIKTLTPDAALLEASRVKTRRGLNVCLVSQEEPLQKPDGAERLPYPRARMHPVDVMVHFLRVECGFVFDGRLVYFGQ